MRKTAAHHGGAAGKVNQGLSTLILDGGDSAMISISQGTRERGVLDPARERAITPRGGIMARIPSGLGDSTKIRVNRP